MKTTIIFGSTTGNTEDVAGQLAELLPEARTLAVASAETSDFEECDLLILGTSTWGFGELQEDWESCLDTLRTANLAEKKVALFGLGDQEGYPSTFVDGLRPLDDAAREAGASLIGRWPADGYDIQDSAALENDLLLGLAIDEDNQSDMTAERLKTWSVQLLNEL